MLASRTQSPIASRSSSVKPNRNRTGPASARLSTSLAVARPPASASSCVATPSSGLVCVSARSASFTRSRWAGCAPLTMSPRPKPATISGANVSMSGHITRMSRGSSVGSSASAPSSTSRSTSTWRAGPWQLCTWTERSVAESERPCTRTALAAISDCSQPSRVGGRSAEPRHRSVAGAGGQAALQFTEVTAQCRQQRVAHSAVRGVPRGGEARRAHRAATSTAPRWDAAATGAVRGGR